MRSAPGGSGTVRGHVAGRAVCFGFILAAQAFAAGIAVDFENRGEGTYTEAMMVQDFNGLSWNNGLDQDRATIVSDVAHGKVLRVVYPEAKVGAGSNDGGVQFKCKLGTITDAAYAEYCVKFQSGFDFVKGGKLPGLCGGQCNTGGDKCTGTDGWSARYMWRREGQAVVYLYDMTMQSYGTDIDLNHPDLFYFEPGRWYTIKQYIEMNDPGIRNGKIRVWIDGKQVLDYKYARFRSTESLGINLFYFSTFFGGGTSEWAPTKDEYIFFDDVRAGDASGSVRGGSAAGTSARRRTFSIVDGHVVLRGSENLRRVILYDCRGMKVGATRSNRVLPGGHLAGGHYVLTIETTGDEQRSYPVLLGSHRTLR